MSEADDRRTAPRTPLKKYFVHFSRDTFLSRIGLGKKNQANLVNASKAGIQVFGTEQLNSGERFRFVLEGKEAAGQKFNFVGTVSWCRRDKEARTFFKAGIKFEDMSEAQLDALQEILDAQPARADASASGPVAAPAAAAPLKSAAKPFA
ncbi:MAG: PilZ domain-containing protein, partial [Planctomycetes bacterium]|nr:PilZ domain-containing protein [Planctomycetota bacterium]